MIVGIPKARAQDERRVAVPPRGVRSLTERGLDVVVERGAGLGAGFPDEQYEQAGGRIVHGPDELWGRADLVAHVGPIAPSEYGLMREGQVIMASLHLAVADPALVRLLCDRGCTAIDFAMIQDDHGTMPVLRPLSQIAGRMVPQIAARYLQTDHGGLGILLGGTPGVAPAERQAIFERLHRGDAARSSGRRGNGLGLALAAEHVRLLDGSITVEDAPSGGARFLVRLPAPQLPDAELDQR